MGRLLGRLVGEGRALVVKQLGVRLTIAMITSGASAADRAPAERPPEAEVTPMVPGVLPGLR